MFTLVGRSALQALLTSFMRFKFLLPVQRTAIKVTFRNEYVELLESFAIEYDEKYLFHDLI